MPDQHLIWTALPRAAGAEQLALAVFLSPRLGAVPNKPRGELSDFPLLEQWPTSAAGAGLEFDVVFDGGTPLRAARSTGPPNAALWSHLFPPTTYVRPYRFPDHSERTLRSFPARWIAAYLRDLYRRIGEQSPTDLPDYGREFEGLVGALGALTNEPAPELDRRLGRQPIDVGTGRDQVLRELDGLLEANAGVMPVEPSGETLAGRDTRMDFAQAARFYDRSESDTGYRGEPELAKVPPGAPEPDRDFHQALGALGDYPGLLRRLGLVFDLTVDRPTAGPSSVQVLPSWNGQRSPDDRSPITDCVVDGERFLALPETGSDLRDGVLDLAGADEPGDEGRGFDLIQIDADGAALKLIHTAGSIRRLQRHRTLNRTAIDTPDGVGLPALQGGGLAVVRRDRAALVRARLQAAAKRDAALDADPPPELHADDVVRGFRVEILDESAPEPQWRSLNLRVGSYRLVDDTGKVIGLVEDDQGTGTIADEGYVKGPSTTSKDADQSDLYLHETILKWMGWSLSAPRPGRVTEPEQGTRLDKRPQGPDVEVPTQTEKIVAPRNRAGEEFRLETSFAPQVGTLPRLRFGHSYRVRMAWVDLAGDPAQPRDDKSGASEAVLFARFEPVPPPALLPRFAYHGGESLERLVIRSDYDVDTAAYVDDPTVVAALATAKEDPYPVDCDRHMAPPKAALEMAEAHAELDDAFGPGGDPEAAFKIALKERGTFKDQKIVDVATGKATIDAGPRAVIHEDEPGEYVVNASAKLKLPYLPDPAALGTALRGLPQLDAGIVGDAEIEVVNSPFVSEPIAKVPSGLAWPGAEPFVLRLAERRGTKDLDDCDEAFAGTDAPHWDAGARVLTVYLGKAETATVRFASYFDLDQLELLGVWRWLEGSAQAGDLRKAALASQHWMLTPHRELTLVHAVQRPLCPPRFDGLESHKDQVGQTFVELRGVLHLSVKSTGRVDVDATWTEDVDLLDEKQPRKLARQAPACDFGVARGWDDKLELPPPVPAEQRAHASHHELGDTRHRFITYRARGTTAFRDYLPAGITGDAGRISRVGEEERVNVLSSARPDAPRVLYAVPAFGWAEHPDLEQPHWREYERERRGGGLRIYLNRPWYSSGDDELLGVVLAPDIGMAGSHVTEFGIDPIWFAALPASPLLTPADFLGAVATEDNLSLEELPGHGQAFRVVGYRPGYDTDRQLWFCDIALDMRKLRPYAPFIRLALARYQPDSIGPDLGVKPDVKLSRVVVADFAQLAPDRMLSILFEDEQHLVATVRGPAPLRPHPNIVCFGLERSERDDPDGLDWEVLQEERCVTPAGDPQELEWTFELTLLDPRGSYPVRLVVREYEQIRADVEARDDVGRRIVYADAVRLA